jgi:hypothetical protein
MRDRKFRFEFDVLGMNGDGEALSHQLTSHLKVALINFCAKRGVKPAFWNEKIEDLEDEPHYGTTKTNG